ncbi:MAG: hypothetical protein A3A98_03790 [Candidatus Staskawiczbacteria bacterium RIFCSPLOWO2_01_FULL_40_39]|uniref:DUF4190 domain-containing protein n=1 Tax=Candidatus Staskawiczbacteria bacterium RIFCSPHIGHO2_01_FULL_39_25 TaxID=1802202 RepID=A0A1G2HNS9_9BACT|nr:MAG: hypothetical protein A2730_03005 [Candidatus Staskawiczbacteria bacterium RIFCSPHIGHO2_01_FULL_39_25]OGZ73532.1 MAG: hypothetical protein A3A98_03790 [Candidatus Staskawiczbacteria bacterium RIFCSPLOWO2_01_FULL_40_39]OGZ75419.1 MAG: hypothetical protein A3I87_03190 [Candidatus Staskawiczbacteria bacterium RIFCSPLOWO2_02_FULL_39_8]
MNKKLAIATLTLMALPVLSMADFQPGPVPDTNPNLDVVGIFNAIFNFIWPFFIGFAVIMFIVAGFQFLTAQGEPGKVTQARNSLIWGAVGVAVGVLAFSIPFVIRNQLNA